MHCTIKQICVGAHISLVSEAFFHLKKTIVRRNGFALNRLAFNSDLSVQKVLTSHTIIEWARYFLWSKDH